MAVRIREVGPPDEDPPYQRKIQHRISCPFPNCDYEVSGRRAKVVRRMASHRKDKHDGEGQEG